MASSKVRKTQRTVQFEVKTLKPLPVGQQVFVSGTQRVLGNWRPDGVPLTPLIGLDQAQFVGQWIDVGEWTLPAEARVSVWATGRLAGNVSGATVGIDAVALLRVGE